MAAQPVRDLAVEEDIQTEIKETLEHNNQSYVDWCNLEDKEKKKNKVKPTITYNMGWQKRSYSRRYDSSSGHVFILGRIRKVSLELSSIPRPSGIVMLQKI